MRHLCVRQLLEIQSCRESLERILYDGIVRSYLLLNKQVEPVRVEANVLVDSKEEFAQRYGNSPALYLVRPDGYVAFRSPAARVHLLRAYLAKLSAGGAPGAD